jgi:hypothetical protein
MPNPSSVPSIVTVDDAARGSSLMSPNYVPPPHRGGRISPTTVAADVSTITANNTSTHGDNDFQSLTNLTVSSPPNAKIIISDPSSQRLAKTPANHSFPPVHSQDNEAASGSNDTIVAVGKHIIELWRSHDFSKYSKINSKLCLDEKKCSFSECGKDGQCLQIILVSSRFTNEGTLERDEIISSFTKEIVSCFKDRYKSMNLVLRTSDEWNRMKSLMRSQA